MKFDVLTLFPDMFTSYLKEGILGRAIERGLVDVALLNIRDFSKGPHRIVDDRPYGGGEGMVMKAGPISRALESVERVEGHGPVVLFSPQGKTFTQDMAWDMVEWKQLIFICGRYEGVDERVRSTCVDMELSIGDYILNGGELAAMVVIEAVSRLIPDVLGGERSNLEDSFENGLLEYPHYTRPRVFGDQAVPPVLLSGDHEKIRLWRKKQSLKRTLSRRADLLQKAELSSEDKAILEKLS
ncbi:MAG: tRNA (guanosine(37)-N1)-methyltransferase TrmD [Deltaproteobacteria bacterium]|nr:tRNA (guanosine(37)-N1)-methyltransferase TrmD [Deltaproteobacteria bacterium]